jgi:hypothetical protein
MKKLLLITSVLAMGALSSMAQGVVNANNAGTGVFIMIQDTTGVIDGGTAVKIGTPATAAGFTAAGPGAVSISLYAVLASANDTVSQILATTPIFTGFNVASTSGPAQGTVAPNGVFVLPTQTGFDGSQVLDFVVKATAGAYVGVSTVGAIQPITATASSQGTAGPAIWGTGSGTGITSLVLIPVPEPSTIVLGGLGAAALLAFRRRK